LRQKLLTIASETATIDHIIIFGGGSIENVWENYDASVVVQQPHMDDFEA